ncbi:hypothetical protein G7077_02580 [Sphingomonas piscis]|uniref:Uncharacterized protein n=1 Tax=Sphingomonas piscis TaxID=2714943 RepID=A0A6G7YLB4_9SPHN|nr:hypothetical protein [Sphingomonas piscis]QIK77528.1 hypothetical protein G7077_02580 [Sphingomonas piscis]
MPNERIVAIGLLTNSDLDLLGSSFDRIWPVEEAPAFPDLLSAIDEADRELQERKNGAPGPVLGGGRY